MDPEQRRRELTRVAELAAEDQREARETEIEDGEW
jgi:hypothetical protein